MNRINAPFLILGRGELREVNGRSVLIIFVLILTVCFLLLSVTYRFFFLKKKETRGGGMGEWDVKSNMVESCLSQT